MNEKRVKTEIKVAIMISSNTTSPVCIYTRPKKIKINAPERLKSPHRSVSKKYTNAPMPPAIVDQILKYNKSPVFNS